MDSLTQIVLGAAVGEAAMGKQIGRKAALWGAVMGTLPDLDVFIVKDAVASFTEHRGFSHSLLVQLLITPLLVWLAQKIHPDTRQYRWRWFGLIYLCLATHALLDGFTIYGTQLLWPLTNYPFGVGSVFIIDPLYTLPLLLCLLFTLVTRSAYVVRIGLFVSSSYLLWSVIAQHWMHNRFDMAWQQQSQSVAERTLTIPMPLNTFLWKNIVVTNEGYWIAYASVFDQGAKTRYQFFDSQQELISTLSNSSEVQSLKRFTKGFYQVKQEGDDVWLSDIRMGGYGRFVFNFNVGTVLEDGRVTATELVTEKSNRPSGNDTKEGLNAIWHRIWQQDVDLFKYF